MKVLLIIIFNLTLFNSSYLESAKDESEADVFIPTNEWQVVRKGQKIPKGLHVRVNFETGVTEAKLLEESTNEQALTYNPEDNPPGEEGLVYPKDVEEALKKIKSDEPESVHIHKEKYRTYEEIKQELHDIDLIPKSDAEVLKELIDKHNDLSSNKHNVQDMLQVLEDLEYLVHQYDNAQEFIKLNGFKSVIYKDLNSTSIKIRLEALKLLGSSMQNNPKIQIHAIETGAVDILLRILSLDNDFDIKSRAVYAIGGLLRRFPLAQQKFIENAGLSVFAKILDSKEVKIQIKIITLLNDLLLEHESALTDVTNSQYKDKVNQYKAVNLKERLKEINVCSLISTLLKNVVQIDKSDYDSVEKSLHVIDSLSDICVYDENVLNNIAKLVNHLKEISNNSNDDAYYNELYELASRLLSVLSHRIKMEL